MVRRALSPAEQRERLASFLVHQRSGVISAFAAQGIWSMPVRYRPASGSLGGRGLELDCLVPRWADVAHRLSETAEVLLIVQAPSWVGVPNGSNEVLEITMPVSNPTWLVT